MNQNLQTIDYLGEKDKKLTFRGKIQENSPVQQCRRRSSRESWSRGRRRRGCSPCCSSRRWRRCAGSRSRLACPCPKSSLSWPGTIWIRRVSGGPCGSCQSDWMRFGIRSTALVWFLRIKNKFRANDHFISGWIKKQSGCKANLRRRRPLESRVKIWFSTSLMLRLMEVRSCSQPTRSVSIVYWV